MKRVLVVGEKTSQVKKFVEVICGSYQSHKQAKYIYTYTGRGNINGKVIDFTFLPLAGHITTIDTRKGYGWGECPPIKLVYDTKALQLKKKNQYVRILNKHITGKDELWLATDPDSEGDNIAMEVVVITKKTIERENITLKRVWNSSLTVAEIKRAFNRPRNWREELALGVQGRRIIDAWLGFAGTRELTRAAREVAKVKVISVGRVQLPTLYLVVKKDLAHEMFVPKDRWQIVAQLYAGEDFEVRQSRGYFYDRKEVNRIIEKVSKASFGRVTNLSSSTKRTSPPVPLNTTAAVSLLSKVLKIPAKKALDNMVELYNRGLLSYPRTENKKFQKDYPHKDILSALLSEKTLLSFIQGLKNTTQVRNNGPKKGEEDHDPIHPTGETDGLVVLSPQLHKTWDILTRYYISLFMDDLVVDITTVEVTIAQELFETEGRTIKDLGWREIQWWKKTKRKGLPHLQLNTQYNLVDVTDQQSKTKPPSRLSDSDLLLDMEKLNIGTKSSRPDIIRKIQQRNYINRRGQNLQSTAWGRALIASLTPIWPDIVTPHFTSQVEDMMDRVARGEQSFGDMLGQLRQKYIKLHKALITKIIDYQNLLMELNLDNQKTKVDPQSVNRILVNMKI